MSGDTQVEKWNAAYTFDDYNNIATKTYTDDANSANNTVTTNTYNKANRLTDQLIKNGSATKHDYEFSYDTAGNLTTKFDQYMTQDTYTYDALNCLSASKNFSTDDITNFTYNANGERIGKTTGTSTTTSVWDGGSIVYDDANNNGTDNVTEYLSGNTMTVQNGTTYGNALDAQGNVLFSTQENTRFSVSRSSENVYDAYGNQTSGGTTGSAKNYRGEYYDSETGLYYLNARYYDPTTQQFTQEDTYWGDVKDPGSLNLYGYCEGNPVMSSDPTGHSNRFTSESGASSGIAYNAQCTLHNEDLDVRSAPSESAKIIGEVFPQERVQILQTSGKFAKVRYSISKPPYHKDGWVHKKYLGKITDQKVVEQNRKKGKTPPSSWPTLPKNLAGKKLKWNPNGYWEGANGGKYTWDGRSHGAGVDRGNGVQGGHWDDENSDRRWDLNGNPLGQQATTAESALVGGSAIVIMGGTIAVGGCLPVRQMCR